MSAKYGSWSTVDATIGCLSRNSNVDARGDAMIIPKARETRVVELSGSLAPKTFVRFARGEMTPPYLSIVLLELLPDTPAKY